MAVLCSGVKIFVGRLGVWSFRYVWGALFGTKNIHTPSSPVYFSLDSSLACMVASRFVTSRLGSSRPAPTWRLVSDRHEPSTFSGVDVHYLKFTSAILSRDMTSGVTVEAVGDDLWRVVTTRRVVTIRCEASPFLRPVTDRVYWT